MINEHFERLKECLEDQQRVYQALLDLVIQEKDLLIHADIAELDKSNKHKEALVGKAKGLDRVREVRVDELLASLQIPPQKIRLTELAQHFSGKEAELLLAYQKSLTLVLERLKEVNVQNEKLTQSAKKAIDGVISVLKGQLPENKVYKKKGSLQKNTHPGSIVSKEV